MRDAVLGVVEPLLDERAQRLAAVFRAQLLEPRLADARRTEHRQVVAVPLLGHADAAAAHADDVVDVLVVALHAHGREDQAAFLVDVARVGHVGRRLRVAAVGLMRLRGGREEMDPLPDHRHEDHVVGRVRVAQVRVVVQEGVAVADVVVQVGDRLRQELHADHVHRQALRRGEQPRIAGDERAREVARLVEHGGAPAAQERVLHLADDRVHAVGDDRQQHRIEAHGCTSSR